MNMVYSSNRKSMRMFASILSIVAILAIALPSTMSVKAAGPWYVAPTGEDSNSCSSIDVPCQTINGAINKATAGDTVYVSVGIYTGSGAQVVLVNKNITLLGGWDTSFLAQTGQSTIDGGGARRGLWVESGATALLEHFTFQNGNVPGGGSGGGIHNAGTLTVADSAVVHNSFVTAIHNTPSGVLTLNNSTVNHNGSTESCFTIVNDGTITINASVVEENMSSSYYCSQLTIVSSGTMTLDNTAVRNNSGGGISNSATLTVNNSVISGNVITSSDFAGGISNYSGALTVNNSTISGNQSINGGGIFARYGSVVRLSNATISKNIAVKGGGIYNDPGFPADILMQNTILAGNTGGPDPDCSGAIGSLGYNIVGDNSGCSFSPVTGDQVGTSSNPINPLLGPLADYGGPTFTHALTKYSPALNAGNPAVPGSGGDSCIGTDQRGVTRPADGICDIGAYEGYVAAVTSIIRGNPNPTSASSVKFTVKFSEDVIGVDNVAPFSDFTIVTTGVTGAGITSVSGSGSLYAVTVKTGKKNGTLRLDLVDDDSILGGSANPLGGPGAGNGNFIGQDYTVHKIPTALSPAGISTWDSTPTYRWSSILGATKYSYQIWKGTTFEYIKTVSPIVCGTSVCADTPTDQLPPGVHKWRVRAMASGIWQPYSTFKTFTVFAPRPGYWRGDWNDFYVTPDWTYVKNFSIYISVTGCRNYKITHTPLVPIVNGKFKFTGSFYANGTFATTGTSATGKAGLYYYYIPGCGYLSGGPFDWKAAWKSGSGPDSGMEVELQFLPGLEGTFPGPFIVDPISR